ncbi:hypothetical protein RHMOL_Rhmol02G0019500 [Rhododendron molle]|uniref:Uncharacterized protein n=1 Tax=Rhododendron molle TaxID=49168 RepID=A0ACC0PL31_RHOML|nr:hypothetical protein RHMOL_Rhmol02G0019500 [Rhododendron molle]
MGTFEKVPMPQPKQSDGDVVYGLGVLNGCLCMSRSENPSDGECNKIEVLVMKEYGMASSWTLMFIISDLRPFGYTRNGEALAVKAPAFSLMPPPRCDDSKDIWHISVYNPINNSTRDIPIPTPMRTHFYALDLIIYEESVIKPTDYNWEDEELRGEATYVEYFLNGSHRKTKMERHTYWRPQVE